MTTKKQIIIIPGIGDDHWVYHRAAALYRTRGYATTIHIYGWANHAQPSYQQRSASLDAVIASKVVDGPLYLVGVSAGGPVAVSALARNPQLIRKVGVICAPLLAFTSSVHPMLQLAIQEAQPFVAAQTLNKQQILSVHGVADMTVPVRLSRPAGIRTITVPSALHPISIFLGLTLFSCPMLRFFKQR